MPDREETPGAPERDLASLQALSQRIAALPPCPVLHVAHFEVGCRFCFVRAYDLIAEHVREATRG